ncbi:MAG: cyanophycin synthetase, partial [Myxococcota bacterium]|nr:cyanophycin synthetase [Myxococcota bacterium]
APAEAIRAGIEGAAPVRGRGVVVRGERGVTVIDDTYNSNPTSAAAAIETLRALPGNGRRVAVLAEMLEMGEAAERVHRAVGRAAAASGVDLLVCVGEHARAMREGAIEAGLPPRRVLAMESVERLLEQVWAIVGRGDRVLVKGSRGMRMERVVERLSRPGAGYGVPQAGDHGAATTTTSTSTRDDTAGGVDAV